ncbi:2OG-Fe(II) oxygenase [Candidatus Neptunochlamydia vexilliferae]|uniref:Prolyl 4-hydroxylase alpha subunit Fe(2+) 2OG dioxygenase domain-containing protein n=1 Tax=Candidatus Neptunichlamydia vexilliferae TaxID=1651774 RepID=A0ABS0B1C3_9BACT|nr:2OG-Fe(II) oxygenase [Candidatus Neptunochlamydia vexilliferae]MBF5059481.1 hypothetical protein [Candidatus Neptunochlamydia vexilliferae]
MEDIEIEYNRDLGALESLLSNVDRPGSYCAEGAVEIPMPRIEVENIGALSFPIPEEQARRLVEESVRAPYGRGEETLVDTSVRNVWQLSPEQVSIKGSSWEGHLDDILSKVKKDLGCQEKSVRAELYKMLVYEKGGFFLPHRDTEKADGMFATLVLSLPSVHAGGELIVRHLGKEKKINLNPVEEVSTICFAAFYADCEHEVLPIEAGNRICLTYNLIWSSDEKSAKLTPPIYDQEVAGVQEHLEAFFDDPSSPPKIAWLLEHEYTSSELSFDTLKSQDAALVHVLKKGAANAGCEVYLGIVHIEESGPAEYYDDDLYYSRGERLDVSYTDLDIVEVDYREAYIDNWINSSNVSMDFGRVPLEGGEALPAGDLDGVPPDEQYLTEATGNEGATFERFYRCAALVIWKKERYAEVLLQGGVENVIPYLNEMVQSGGSKNLILKAGEKTLDRLESILEDSSYRFARELSSKEQFFSALIATGEKSLVIRFIETVLYRVYDESDNASLIKAILFLGKHLPADLLPQLIASRIEKKPIACVELLALLMENGLDKGTLEGVVSKVVTFIPKIKVEIEPLFVIKLWRVLIAFELTDLANNAAHAVIANSSIFDPKFVLLPALQELHQANKEIFKQQKELVLIWKYIGKVLLERSGHPPQPPADWKIEAKPSCKCEDCKELHSFLLDPLEEIHRFRVRKDRRQHLHNVIGYLGVDVSHVTERIGSPQTLVCTKTRRTYKLQLEIYESDIEGMKALQSLPPSYPEIDSDLVDAIDLSVGFSSLNS